MIRFPESWRDLRVTLVHDWLTGMRGGERVLEILCQAFPRAPILTLIHRREAVSAAINAHRIRTSWLQHIPGIFKHYRYFLPLFPGAMAGLRAPPSDLVISTSHCVAKAVQSGPRTPHLCYCFTPMRYAWVHQEEYFRGRPALKALAKPVLRQIRSWDVRVCDRVDHFVAISRHVQERIRRCYQRESDVLYPPVDTDRWTPARPGHAGYDLIVSALVPYKRVDLAVAAYNRMHFPLKIVGVGTEEQRLRRLAGPSVEFLGRRPDEEVLALYQGCRHLIFPGHEDFGLVPLEAQACGKPVVAFRAGGLLESVAEGVTGVFFERQDEDSLMAAVRRAASLPWDPTAIRAHAERFHPQVFVDGLAAQMARLLR